MPVVFGSQNTAGVLARTSKGQKVTEQERHDHARYWLDVVNHGMSSVSVTRGYTGSITELLFLTKDGRTVKVTAPQGMTIEEVEG